MKSDKRRAQKLILYSEIYFLFFFSGTRTIQHSKMEKYSQHQRLIDIHIHIIILLIKFDILIRR